MPGERSTYIGPQWGIDRIKDSHRDIGWSHQKMAENAHFEIGEDPCRPNVDPKLKNN